MNYSPFEYLYLDENLYQRATDLVAKRESIVVLGYRNSGKTALVNSVFQRLKREGIGPLIKVDFLRAQSVSKSSEVRSLIAAAAEVAPPQTDSDDEPDMLLPLLQLDESLGVPIFAALNVDAIQPSAARGLLRQIRTRVNEGTLVAVLTGQHDLRHLVHGEDSAFNCTHQWVMQGLGKEEFTRVGETYARAMAIDLADPQSVFEYLFEQMGGNAYLLKGGLWLVIERTKNRKKPCKITIDDLRSELGKAPIFGMRDLDSLRLASRLVGSDPKCWKNLIRLIDGKEARLKEPRGVPGSLTLTGIAVRKDGCLQFASPLMTTLVCCHYDRIRLGDLYARQGAWGRAFRLYHMGSQLYGEERLRRPVSLDERPDVELAVNALCSSFYRLSQTRRLADRLVRGLRYVLGFRVSLWNVESLKLSRMAVGRASSQRPLFDGELDVAAEAFCGDDKRFGIQEIKSDWAPYVNAHLLHSESRNRRLGVLIHNLDTRESAHFDRWEFCNRIMDDFVRAYQQTLNEEERKRDLAARTVFQRAIDTIVNLMGGKIKDVRDAIRSACAELVTLNYKRVSVCLPSADGNRIQTVACVPVDDFDVLQKTDWEIAHEEQGIKNLQQWVLYHHRAYEVHNARTDKLTNREIVEALNLDRFVVVPMFYPEKGVAGTIHVERIDGKMPSPEEIDGLIDFGRSLAIALEQVKRLTLEQRTLDGIQDPVVIVDAQRKVYYANRHASQLLDVAPGRHESPTSQIEDANFSRLLEKAWVSSRSGGQFHGLGNDKAYGAIATTAVVKDWRDQIIGGFFAAENVTYLMRCIEALDEIAQSETINDALIKLLPIAAATLRHSWTRLYRTVGGNLVGEKSFPESKEFIGCQIKDDLSRRCILERRLVALQYLPNCDASESETAEGLSVLAVASQPPQPFLYKEPGQIWVDFPLLTRTGVLGKLSLGCKKDFRPGDFAVLQKLCDWLQGLFEAFEQRDRAIARTMERAMADFSHSFDTRFKGLTLVTDRLRSFEDCPPRFRQVVIELEEKLTTLEELSHGAKKKLRMLHPVLAFFDLRFLLVRLSSGRIEHKVGRNELYHPFWGDQDLMQELFDELLENSAIAGATKAETSVSTCSDVIEIVYRDNGPGVDPKYRESGIFELGFSSRPKGQTRGNGHGMGQIRRIIEKHNGTIKVAGQFEGGQITSFTGFECIMRFPRKVKAND